jgi:O-acetyl-ADP-ribose deacetylase (regulator of RNase III)
MIRVVEHPLPALAVDAVVRAADDRLRPVGPVSEAIDREAGTRFTMERQVQTALDVGAAVITGGGDLAAEFVLHVVIQGDDRALSRETVRRALTSAWHRAEGWQLMTVGASLSGLGLSLAEAALALIETFRDRPGSTGFPAELHIVIEDPDQRAAVEPFLKNGSP